MAVFGTFATILMTTVVQTARLARETSLRETTAQQASVIMATLSRDVRTALPLGSGPSNRLAFTAATPTELVFYSSVEPEILRERIYVDTTGVHRSITVPDVGSTYPDLTYASPDPTRTTTRRLAGTKLAVSQLFAYYLGAAPTPVTSVSPADLDDITAIAIRVEVDGDGAGRVAPIVLESVVRPFNT